MMVHLLREFISPECGRSCAGLVLMAKCSDLYIATTGMESGAPSSTQGNLWRGPALTCDLIVQNTESDDTQWTRNGVWQEDCED
jgi:hypothetical protein